MGETIPSSSTPRWVGRIAGLSPWWTWALASVWTIAWMIDAHWQLIASFSLPDTDDALRMQQVRDWMAGQPWFDVTQYRINPPDGGMMHWSRLIDLPIAALIALVEPFAGRAEAERWVAALYPPALAVLLLGVITWAMQRFNRAALTHLTLVMAALTGGIMVRFLPMRIDHHGWQVILATVVLGFALGSPNRRNGVLAGLAMALYASISIEAAAFMAVFAALFAGDWITGREDGRRFAGFAGALALATPLLLVATQGISAPFRSYCDAISLPYMVFLSVAAGLALAGIKWLPLRTPLHRGAMLAGAGLLAFGAFALADPRCLDGPFVALDAKVRFLWYNHVLEGRPIWLAPRGVRWVAWYAIAVGLAGSLLAWSRATGEDRARWRSATIALVGAGAIATMVMRTYSIAHIYALPGTAWLILELAALFWARIVAPWRVIAIAALFSLTPGFAAIAVEQWTERNKAQADADAPPAPSWTKVTRKRNVSCLDGGARNALAALPAGLVFAPLDLSPFIVAYSPHSVIATGHHRNGAAMRRVHDGFTYSPRAARGIIERSGADYVIICRGVAETALFARYYPNGLSSALLKKTPPDWLEKIDQPGDATLDIYKVRFAEPVRPGGNPSPAR